LYYRAFVPAFTTEMERAKTHQYPLTLVLMAVDAFRKYLDMYGMQEAHALLAKVVEIATRHITDMDILARFSADEFILCLSGAKGAEATAKLEKIR